MNKLFACVLVLAATSAIADDHRFSAADVPQVKLKGKIVIKNDATSISAYRFFNNVAEALVKLRATRPESQARAFTDGSISNAGALTELFNAAARENNVDARLLAAVAHRESRGNANAVSPVGACGVMQLMPSTARYLGVSNIFDPRENILAGAKYLRTLLDTFNGDLDLTLAAYNAGPGAVQRYGGVPPYRETRAYVAAVRGAYEKSITR